MPFDAAATTLALVLEPGAGGGELRAIQTNDPATLQALVGGWLGALDVAQGAALFFNEEGRLHRLVRNDLASRLAYAAGLDDSDAILGTAVLAGLDWPEGEPEMGRVQVDVTDAVLAWCAEAGVPVTGPSS